MNNLFSKSAILILLLSMSIEINAQSKRNLKQEETNKKIVSTLYQSLFGDKDTSAIDKYIVEDYIQHNPMVADGRKALKDGVEKWFVGAPKEKIDIQHIAADGDLVFIHLKSKGADGKLTSVIDIFKLKNNKIVEHWDVMQAVPEKSANNHPMF
ncbi:ester cyclase [Flavobacterium sp. GB2R13]|uniref:nuclear transport factor 2 family protein n=1 Tax=Flavobacterium algoris TaxID=3398733 RepID=UPI003A887FE2